MRPVLVTGGTGRLGRPLVDRFVAAGSPVRVASRRPGPSRPGVEYVTADVRTGTGLAAAMAGVCAVVHCATTNGRGDIAAMRNLLGAAAAAGSPHLVYVSIVGVDRVPILYYRAKLAAEGLLAASGLPWTLLRATQFHDLVSDVFDLQRRSPVFVVPARTDVQPVDTRDVAARLAELVAGPPAGRVPDMGGPQVHGVRELADAYIRARGLRRAVLPLPLPGPAGRAYRAGRHLAPEHTTGRLTYADHLRHRVGDS